MVQVHVRAFSLIGLASSTLGWYTLMTMVMTPRVHSWRRYRPEGVPICTWWVISASDEQLLVVPFVMRTLRMAGLGECPFGPLHSEDEEATEIRLRYSGYREGADSDSCFDLHEPILLFIRAPRGLGRESLPDVEVLGEENVLGLISRTLFISGRVVYNWRSRYRPPHTVDDQVHWQSRHPGVPVPSKLDLPQCV